MSSRLVCPADPELLSSLGGYELVLRVSSPDAVAPAVDVARGAGATPRVVILDAKIALAELELEATPADVPLAVWASEAGLFRALRPRLPVLQRPTLKVFLPAEEPENLVALRILSSLGVAGCAVLQAMDQSWNALADLMTWAVLGAVPHAPLDPFAYLADHYDPAASTPWGHVTFDDPRRYLHLDREGRVALSHQELVSETFVARAPADLPDVERLPAFQERLQAPRLRLLDRTPCATCEGHRVCEGRFQRSPSPSAPGCIAFFTEFLEVVEQRQAQRASQPVPRWPY